MINLLKNILNYCGYSAINLNDEKKLYFFSKKKKIIKKINKKSKNKKNTKPKIKPDPNSPFAVLEKLL